MAGINQTEFDEIFMEWYYPVRNSIYYKSGDMPFSEDITQEAFIKIWEKRDSVKKETVGPLLYKISANLFLNAVDHSKVEMKFVANQDINALSVSPEYELEMKDFDNRLHKALSDLDEKLRVVFLMNRIDDMTYNQIADNLGLSVKAIEKRMSKAMAFLQDQLRIKI
ncbi:MAG TPA: sigma-70 family RNA polymerase sigma factor [Bacteroidales bacterium]|nr:sigma-70 family RNA polymerase sigma factor [Bacteroidales bacterium]